MARKKLGIGQAITEKMAFDFMESKWESGKGHGTLKCMYRVSHMYLNDFRMPLGESGVMVRQI